jgi:hypothetical protein
MTLARWRQVGWRGWIEPGAPADPLAWVAAADTAAVRTSRHARTVRIVSAGDTLFVKRYPAPDGSRALRAFRMGEALRAAGFRAPAAVLVGRRGGEGLLVTRDGGGEELIAAVARAGRAAKRALLRGLGAEVGRLHEAGFVHGDLVPPNLRVVDGRFLFLDNDRTRRSAALVYLAGRRNLVQLGRFVVPGVTATDRARVLAGYAAARGLSRAARRRLARWVVAKTIARRCAIDRIPSAIAARAGYRELMRSGGRFDTKAGG